MNIDEFLDSQSQQKEVVQQSGPAEIATASASIRDKLATIKGLIVEKKFEDASTAFSSIRDDFARLMQLQEKERIFIQGEMEHISADLMNRMDKLSDEVEKRAEIIRRLLDKAQQQLMSSDFMAANQSYASMRDILAGMPEGFVERKSQLEGEILAFYIKFKEKYTGSQKAKFDMLIAQISATLDQAENLALQNNRDQAQYLLLQSKSAFERLPAGFIYDKTELHKRIVDLTSSLSQPGMQQRKYQQVTEPVPGQVPTAQPAKKGIFSWK